MVSRSVKKCQANLDTYRRFGLKFFGRRICFCLLSGSSHRGSGVLDFPFGRGWSAPAIRRRGRRTPILVLTKRPGDLVELTVEHIGEPKPLMLDGVFRARALAEASEGLTKSCALEITGLFHIPFLLVAFTVLALEAGGTECVASGIAVRRFCRRPSQLCARVLGNVKSHFKLS